jgi:hypothetical protein
MYDDVSKLIWYNRHHEARFELKMVFKWSKHCARNSKHLSLRVKTSLRE